MLLKCLIMEQRNSNRIMEEFFKHQTEYIKDSKGSEKEISISLCHDKGLQSVLNDFCVLQLSKNPYLAVPNLCQLFVEYMKGLLDGSSSVQKHVRQYLQSNDGVLSMYVLFVMVFVSLIL